MARRRRQRRPAKKKVEFSSTEHILRWINGYRLRPDPGKLPTAVKAMSELGVFRDMDQAGIYVGFMAGVLQTNPNAPRSWSASMFPMPPEDQVAIVRAIAYSELPEWKDLMLEFAERMPARKALIDRFVYGKQPTLKQMALDCRHRAAGHAVGHLLRHRRLSSRSLRMVSILVWAKDQNNVERLTIGSMAKLSLATNASRDKELLDMLKGSMNGEGKDTRVVLQEVIDAAETFEFGPRAQGRDGGHRPTEVEGPGIRAQRVVVGNGGTDGAGLGLHRCRRHGPCRGRHSLRTGRRGLRRRAQVHHAAVAGPRFLVDRPASSPMPGQARISACAILMYKIN